VALVAGLLAAATARKAFQRRIAGEVAALLAASQTRPPAIVSDADLVGLPEPVQRWLRWAQVVGKPYPATVRLTQEGRFRQAKGQPWMSFTAVEHVTTDPPGFVWTTAMRLFPLLSISGRDSHRDGRGSIEMRALGLIPVAKASGPAIDQGALLRYLNETMWFPAAAARSPDITWEVIDASAARATIRYRDATGSAIFVFDAQGRPVDMVARRQDLARGRLETWSTPISAYGQFDGVRIPVAGSGVWRYETGDFTYIELRITTYEGAG
jgi:hypothetical protein